MSEELQRNSIRELREGKITDECSPDQKHEVGSRGFC